MKIIDFHDHIYPEKISVKAVKSVGDFYGLKMDCQGTAQSLIASGKKAGVSNYVVCSVAVDENHVEAINNYIASECAEHSEFLGLAAMHSDYDDKMSELERALKLGLRGVKIHPDTQHFNMDDEKMFEFYDYLQEKELPILIHCGDYRYDYSHPRRLKRLLELFPRLTVVAAHFGGWSLFDLAVEYLKDTSCYFDTSSSFSFTGLTRAGELIRLYGAERIVFGSDFPMWDLSEELSLFEQLTLTEQEKELILYKNAERILKLEE